jgi:uncharacterized protein (TIGR03118 family)
MIPYRPRNTLLAPALLGAVALCLSPSISSALGAYSQTNLVSDIPGLASHTDPNLKNPWGISASATSPFWVSDAGTGVSTLYDSAGNINARVVTIPGPGVGPSVPTGQIFNGTPSFNADNFVFASARGTITGWRAALGNTAEILVNNSSVGASYLGLANGTTGGNNYLYAADFGRGEIDVFTGVSITATTLAGLFKDPLLPVGYSPFNIQNLGGSLYVTYALKGADGKDAKGAGHGVVDKYDLNGNLVSRIASGGVLNSPWGVALAPSSFGAFANDLLVGNLGDGTINAFDPTTGAFVGTIQDGNGNPLVNDGLWGLQFGNGAAAGTLFFAAGIQDETHGLFGAITPVPEPATTGAMGAAALVGLCVVARVRRRRPALAVIEVQK